jgi:hypothetical protein
VGSRDGVPRCSALSVDATAPRRRRKSTLTPPWRMAGNVRWQIVCSFQISGLLTVCTCNVVRTVGRRLRSAPPLERAHRCARAKKCVSSRPMCGVNEVGAVVESSDAAVSWWSVAGVAGVARSVRAKWRLETGGSRLPRIARGAILRICPERQVRLVEGSERAGAGERAA